MFGLECPFLFSVAQLQQNFALLRILSDAAKIPETFQSSESIRQVAQAYAELGNSGEALRLAQPCSGEDKVAVLARILRVHAEQQNPEFKALREKKPDEE